MLRLAAFLINCGYETAQRRLNGLNTLHMPLATILFFITPALQNLNIAFQGPDTWHSFQYLAVVIFLNRCRKASGSIGSATRFAAGGWGMDTVGIRLTAACGVPYLAMRGLVVLIDAWPRDPAPQHSSASPSPCCRAPHALILRPRHLAPAHGHCLAHSTDPRNSKVS